MGTNTIYKLMDSGHHFMWTGIKNIIDTYDLYVTSLS